MYIYIIQNNLSGKYYIGKCEKKLEQTKKYFGSGNNIKKAIKKYGKEHFSKYIIKNNIQSLEELNKLEVFYINFFKTNEYCYNIANGGDGGNIYQNLSENQKILMKEKCASFGENNGMYKKGFLLKGDKNGRFNNPLYKIWKEKYSDSEYLEKVKIYSNKISESNKKRFSCKELKEKISLMYKGENNPNAQIYLLYDNNDNIVEIFNGNKSDFLKKYPTTLFKTYKNNKKFKTNYKINTQYNGWYVVKINKKENNKNGK